MANSEIRHNCATTQFDLEKQWVVILNRLRTLENLLRLLVQDSRDTNFKSWKQNVIISPFWRCNSNSVCKENCNICCQSLVRMYIDCHLLSGRDNVGENFFAVWKILCSIRHREQQVKYQAEQEAKRFPDDLQSLIDDWDNLPEIKSGAKLTLLKDDELASIIDDVLGLEEERKNANLARTQKKREKSLIFSRPIKISRPQFTQMKLAAQKENFKNQIGRMISVHAGQKRSILQNRTNLAPMQTAPIASNASLALNKIGMNVVRSGRCMKQSDQARRLLVPRAPLLSRTAAGRMILTPLVDSSGRPILNQMMNQPERLILNQMVNQSERPILNHLVSRPILSASTSLLPPSNVVSFHREFTRQVQPKVAFIKCNPTSVVPSSPSPSSPSILPNPGDKKLQR